MEATIKIRRDADGSTEEVQADVTLTDSAINIHPRQSMQVSEGDILIIPTAPEAPGPPRPETA